MAKVCKRCGSELYKEGGKRGPMRCKPCRDIKHKERQEEIKREYYSYISEIGCLCCEEAHSYALEVHHLSTGYKRYGRSQGWKYNKEDLEESLAVVLCASCHNIFHGHFGGKNAPFPTQTKESVQQIVEFARRIKP